jgi:hypothetical protein
VFVLLAAIAWQSGECLQSETMGIDDGGSHIRVSAGERGESLSFRKW